MIEVVTEKGSRKAIYELKKKQFLLSSLKDFSYTEGSMDRGVKIRDLAKKLVDKIDNAKSEDYGEIIYKNKDKTRDDFSYGTKPHRSELRSKSNYPRAKKMIKSDFQKLTSFKRKKKEKIEELGYGKDFLKFETNRKDIITL